MVRRYLKAGGGLSRRGVRKSLVKSRRHVQRALDVGGKCEVESEREPGNGECYRGGQGLVGRICEVLVDAANHTPFTTSIALIRSDRTLFRSYFLVSIFFYCHDFVRVQSNYTVANLYAHKMVCP